jgi:MFS family permease
MAEPSVRLPLGLIAAVTLTASLGPLNSTMVAVALPEMGRVFHADSGALRQALVTSYLLTNIVLQSPGGKLGDRVGHRRALTLGQLVFAAGAALGYLFPSLSVLALARVTMGVGAAVTAPSAMALLRTELPKEVRGRAFGVFGAVMGLAAGTGPKLGALLVERFGWASIFLANVPVLLVSAALVHVGRQSAPAAAAHVPAAPAAPRSRFDVLGSLLLGASLLGLVLGLERPHLRWALVIAALGFPAFALWEKRAADPIVDFSLFKLRAFMGGSSIIALQNFALYSMMFELPQVGGRLFGVTARDVGNTLVAMMASMVVASPIAGRATERFGARAVALAGCSTALLGMALLAARPLTAMTDAVPALILLGAGLGLATVPSQSAAMSDVPPNKSGMAAGLTSTFRYVGGVAGVTALGLILTDNPAPLVAQREHVTAIAIFCVSLAITIACALALPGRAPARPPAVEAR